MLGLAGQQKEVEWIEPYGLATAPLPGSETLALCIDGNESGSVALTVGDRRFRFDVADGEVALYTYLNAAEEHRLHFRGDRTIELLGKALRIAVPEGADIVGDVRIDGNVWATGDVVADGTVTGKTEVIFGSIRGSMHAHPDVQRGDDISGGPQ
ncbi:phage baseplate assembly protein domain-containing protein [Paraburkholderia tuberum]|nr:phage baseplate assembly protein [Paraburkholderia tuberum]